MWMAALKWPSDEESLSCQKRLSFNLLRSDSAQSKSLLEPHEIENRQTTLSEKSLQIYLSALIRILQHIFAFLRLFWVKKGKHMILVGFFMYKYIFLIIHNKKRFSQPKWIGGEWEIQRLASFEPQKTEKDADNVKLNIPIIGESIKCPRVHQHFLSSP